MKKLSFVVVALALVAFAGPSLAQPPAKSTILHCGCVFRDGEGATMEYVEISVRPRAIGHINHVSGTTDDCFAGLDENDEPVLVNFTRSNDDCWVSGAQLGDLSECDEGASQVEGQLCGGETDN